MRTAMLNTPNVALLCVDCGVRVYLKWGAGGRTEDKGKRKAGVGTARLARRDWQLNVDR